PCARATREPEAEQEAGVESATVDGLDRAPPLRRPQTPILREREEPRTSVPRMGLRPLIRPPRCRTPCSPKDQRADARSRAVARPAAPGRTLPRAGIRARVPGAGIRAGRAPRG